MATLRILEMPDALFHSIERRAGCQGISIQQLVVRELTELEQSRENQEEMLLADIRREREAMSARGIKLTDEILRQARNWGRE